MSAAGQKTSQRWLQWYATAAAAVCLALLSVGGLVTSRGAGMSVPDWPTSYGYNMFALPFSHWIGGAFYEHSHRLVATAMGLLTVGLTRWVGGRGARRPLALIGLLELAAGLLILLLAPGLKGTGHFLMGIGLVVLLAAALPFKAPPAPAPLPVLGWCAFGMVQLIGLLGGLRVVLYKDELGVFHATLAQLFFLVLVATALLSSRAWGQAVETGSRAWELPARWRKAGLVITLLVLGQLVIGATMRHQHAGLAIPDFPLAYGKVWPAVDASSIEIYNQHRTELTAVAPIQAFHVELQMAHRLMALVLALSIGAWTLAAWRHRHHARLAARLGLVWSLLVVVQVILGAFTIWTDKAADVATLHVVAGALTLALGGLITLFSFPEYLRGRPAGPRDTVPLFGAPQPNPARSIP